MSRKWHDLRERIAASPARPPVLTKDVRKPRSKRFLCPADVTSIVARYEAGETTQQVSTHYGISKTRVATVLRDQGIIIRRQGLNDEQVFEAAHLYAAGKSLAWLGARYGVSHTTIATALRRQGLPLRRRPGCN
jgi:Helix-turn-helix domain